MFEPPGGFTSDNKHRLESLQVTVDGVAINSWYSICLFNTLQYSTCLFNRYSPSLPNVKSGLMKKYYMDFFINSNSYMSDNIPDVVYTPEFEKYFNFYTFCLTSDTKQSSQHLPICKTG